MRASRWFAEVCVLLLLAMDADGSPLPADWRSYLSPKSLEDKSRTGLADSALLANGDVVEDAPGISLKGPSKNRNAISDGTLRWDRGIIPFKLKSRFGRLQENIIRGAMGHIEEETCIRFKSHTRADKDYIVFVNDVPDACFSYVGRRGNEQIVNVAMPRCGFGATVHELLHAIGFLHEQMRSDRDDYVTINWDNIPPSRHLAFAKLNSNNLGTTYDYGSIMHYPAFHFAIDPKVPTILPKKKNTTLGQLEGMSELDILKVNLLYKCQDGDSGYEDLSNDRSWAADPNCFKYITVQYRDTCTKAAEKCKVTVKGLYANNAQLKNGDACMDFSVGQRLCCISKTEATAVIAKK